MGRAALLPCRYEFVSSDVGKECIIAYRDAPAAARSASPALAAPNGYTCAHWHSAMPAVHAEVDGARKAASLPKLIEDGSVAQRRSIDRCLASEARD